ncbi:hypothetical protein [Stieleria maiorica]|nr:hypothetical protein [Stieleria maiorica]
MADVFGDLFRAATDLSLGSLETHVRLSGYHNAHWFRVIRVFRGEPPLY